jgi:hypothetical protein
MGPFIQALHLELDEEIWDGLQQPFPQLGKKQIP